MWDYLNASKDTDMNPMVTFPGQDGHHFADNILKCILVNEKFCILVKISLKFVPKVPIDNNPALV